MSEQQWASMMLIAAWGIVWFAEFMRYRRRCNRAESLLAEASARLSLHYSNPLDADVCDRVLEHFAGRS